MQVPEQTGQIQVSGPIRCHKVRTLTLFELDQGLSIVFLEAVTAELEVARLLPLHSVSGCLLWLGLEVDKSCLASDLLVDWDHGLAFVARGHRDRFLLP